MTGPATHVRAGPAHPVAVAVVLLVAAIGVLLGAFLSGWSVFEVLAWVVLGVAGGFAISGSV